jgi:hypothetical protein
MTNVIASVIQSRLELTSTSGTQNNNKIPNQLMINPGTTGRTLPTRPTRQQINPRLTKSILIVKFCKIELKTKELAPLIPYFCQNY